MTKKGYMIPFYCQGGLRLGLSFWGFTSDYKEDEAGNELSTPDGTATYVWSILHEAQARGWRTYAMQDDRDRHTVRKRGTAAFSAFSTAKRKRAYDRTFQTNGVDLPELDVLLLEWRWPIPGRNCLETFDKDGRMFPPVVDSSTGLQPDLLRQLELLEHYYQKGTPIIVWDLDHKLQDSDEARWCPHIFEMSAIPRFQVCPRIRVEPPFVTGDLLQHPTLSDDPARKLVYIGSRYERDDVIDEWIGPVSRAYPQQVEFHGNWLKTLDECRARWPDVKYCDRVTIRDFRRVYGTAAACPLLGKRSYLKHGFITHRPAEAILFGTIPVGLGSHLGVERYVHSGLIAGDGNDMIEVVETLSGISPAERHVLREENAHQLAHTDVRHFVDRIEDVVNGHADTIAAAPALAGEDGKED